MNENPLKHGLLFRCEPGLPFLPSNGEEGSAFEEAFCETCIYENPDDDSWCPVHSDALIGKQPKEWIHDEDGIPTCTKYKRRSHAN